MCDSGQDRARFQKQTTDYRHYSSAASMAESAWLLVARKQSGSGGEARSSTPPPDLRFVHRSRSFSVLRALRERYTRTGSASTEAEQTGRTENFEGSIPRLELKTVRERAGGPPSEKTVARKKHKNSEEQKSRESPECNNPTA